MNSEYLAVNFYILRMKIKVVLKIQRKVCLFILFLKLSWRTKESPRCRKHLIKPPFGLHREALKGLAFPFRLSYRKWTQILKRVVVSHSRLQKQVREVLSLGRAHQVCTVCQGPHQAVVVQTRRRQTGHSATPQGPWGQTAWPSQHPPHVPPVQPQRAGSYFTRNSTRGGFCPLLLCITQSRCSRNETGPQSEGKRRAERSCCLGWILKVRQGDRFSMQEIHI